MTPRHHRVLVRVLFAVATVIALVALFAVWANRQVLNTDNWTKTSSQLLENKNIQNALGAYMVDQLFTSVNVQQLLENRLPPQADALAGPAAAGLKQLANSRAPIFLARPRVQDAWRIANRAAHKQLLTIINGGGKTVSTKNGEVVLNLRPLIGSLAADLGLEQQAQAAQQKLQGSAGAQARQTAQQKLGVTLPASTGQLTIMKSNSLSTVQSIADGIRNLAFVLTPLALLLFALAVWLARGWRREALRTTGWCFIGLGLLVLIGRRYIGNDVVDGLVSNASVKPAAHSAWTIGTTLLYDIGIAMFLYGVIFVLSAWLAGSTRLAVGIRRALAPSLRERPVMVYAVVTTLFLLVLLWGPTPATRKPLGIALFAVLIVLGVELLRRQADREYPDARPGETGDRLRAWWDGRRQPQTASANGGARESVADRFDELDRAAALHDRGVLSDEEFTTQKNLILHRSDN